MSARLSLPVAVMRRVVLAVLALGVMFGLTAMHEVIAIPAPDVSAVASQLEQTPAHLVADMAATMVAGSPMTGPMAGMGQQCMETCCLALVVMLALAVLALPGLLGMLGPLRPRAQLPRVSGGRVLGGIERTLTLGVLRI